METGLKKDILSISNGQGELGSQHLQEEGGNNGNEVKSFDFISIKKEEPEQDDNKLFVKLIKKEEGDLGDAFTDNKPSSFSFVKSEPETSAFEFEHFPRNINMQVVSDSSAMDLNKFNDFSVALIDNVVKVDDTTKTNKIKISDEILFEQRKIKIEQVDIKTEDLEQSENSFSHTCFGYETHKGSLKNNENRFDDQETQEQNIKKPCTDQVSPGEVLKCYHCDFQTLYKSCLSRHVLRHKNPKYVKMFKCDQCNFQTLYKSCLSRHVLSRHKNPKDVNMFKCDHCDYQIFEKSLLNIHVRRHQNP